MKEVGNKNRERQQRLLKKTIGVAIHRMAASRGFVFQEHPTAVEMGPTSSTTRHNMCCWTPRRDVHHPPDAAFDG